MARLIRFSGELHVFFTSPISDARCNSANSYWVGLRGLTTDEMNVAFQNIAATGGTTVRTW